MTRCRKGFDHDELRTTPALWVTLVYVGRQIVEADETGPAETLELRNCECGSTLCITVTPK